MKPRSSIIVVVNPTSGAGRGRQLLEGLKQGNAALKILSGDIGADDPSTWPVIETTKDGSWCQELALQARGRGAFAVMVIGGDGTLMETAGALHGRVPEAKTIALIPVPGGRGNDFVRGLCGYSLKDGDFWAWAGRQKKWKNGPLDLASANGRIFINMASVGYGGRVVEKAHHRNAFWSKSSLVYQVEGALALFESGGGRCEVKSSGNTVYSGDFFGAFVGNGPANGSGLYWVRNAKTNDGRIDAIVFPRPSVLEMAKGMSAIKERREPPFKHTEIQSEEIVFHFDRPTPLELDGDYVGTSLQHEFRCLKGAMSVWSLTSP